MAMKLAKRERIRPKDGLFEYRYKNVLGKTVSIYAHSLAELRQKEEALSDMATRGININKPFITLDEEFLHWCDYKRGLKPNTMANYQYMYRRYVFGGFGANKIRDLIKSDFKKLYIHLHDKKHLQISTIDAVHTVIHQVLEMAMDDDLIRNNPSDRALKELKIEENSFKLEKKRKFLTEEEEKILFDFIRNSDMYRRWDNVFRFLIRTGLRIGEFAALQNSDIDYENRVIHITKTMVDYSVKMKNGMMKTTYEIHSPKTRAGIRDIPLTREIEETLANEKEYQKLIYLESKSEVNGYSDFVFLTIAGTFYKGNTLNKALERITNSCNEERVRKYGKNAVLLPRISCHMLRHTFNSRLQNCGIMVEERMALLGHSDASVNIGTYTHVSGKKKLEAMEKLESIYSANENG